jgi:hypothetical protein
LVSLLLLFGAFVVEVLGSGAAVAFVVGWAEVVDVVGAACVVGDDVVCGVGSG